MEYLKAFLIGGLFCLVGQILIDRTKLTPARILVSYVVAGVFLSAVGLYKPLVDFAGCGATVPLTGFGHTLAKGVRMSTEGDALRIDCEIVAQFGQPVFVLARNVQEHVKSCVESLTGLSVAQVNVNVSGIALPREGKK